MDNTLLPSIRALWRFFVIRFLSLSRLATSRPLHSFSGALDREGLTDDNLYDTLHAELSFETGDDDAAMAPPSVPWPTSERRTRLSTASAAMSVSFQPGRHGGRVAALGGGGAGIVEHEIGIPPLLN